MPAIENATLQEKLQQAPVGFAVVEGPAMVFTVANERYLEMASRADVVGRRWVDVFPELVGTPTHAVVLSAYAGTRIEVAEYPVVFEREGTLREVFFSFVLDPTRGSDGNVDGFIVIATDVTELVMQRREAETLAAKLRRSEDRYRSLFGAMDDGFCLLEMIFDRDSKAVDYRFLEVNEAFLVHTGLSDPVGRTARELVPDLDESWFRLYGEVSLTGKSARFENNAPAMGRWFDVFASRVGDPALQQVGLVFKDVSARRRAEQEKAELLAAEQAARRDAEAANRLKDEFLATVSHELRTPLSAILGWTTLLLGGKIGPEKTVRALETIERNARSQAQLIEDLLDVSRILEGKLSLEIKPTEVRSVIESALDTVRHAADAKGVRLQTSLVSTAVAMGDAHRLQQVVWNLLSNAVKFTPKDGTAHVALTDNGLQIEITVIDTGVGIEQEFLPLVFERFRQADGGTMRVQGGLGLGLSIVRHLVQMHGGSVDAFSEGKGRGARFTVRLPSATAQKIGATESSDAHPPVAPQGAVPDLRGLKVLAVDDENDSRELLRAILEACGAKVTVASCASDAFSLFQQEPPDILLSDIGMPGEDGFSLMAKIRSLPTDAGRSIPAVALTAYARAEDIAKCLDAGFRSHVSKPVEPSALLKVVAALTERVGAAKR